MGLEGREQSEADNKTKTKYLGSHYSRKTLQATAEGMSETSQFMNQVHNFLNSALGTGPDPTH